MPEWGWERQIQMVRYLGVSSNAASDDAHRVTALQPIHSTKPSMTVESVTGKRDQIPPLDAPCQNCVYSLRMQRSFLLHYSINACSPSLKAVPERRAMPDYSITCLVPAHSIQLMTQSPTHTDRRHPWLMARKPLVPPSMTGSTPRIHKNIITCPNITSKRI